MEIYHQSVSFHLKHNQGWGYISTAQAPAWQVVGSEFDSQCVYEGDMNTTGKIIEIEISNSGSQGLSEGVMRSG